MAKSWSHIGLWVVLIGMLTACDTVPQKNQSVASEPEMHSSEMRQEQQEKRSSKAGQEQQEKRSSKAGQEQQKPILLAKRSSKRSAQRARSRYISSYVVRGKRYRVLRSSSGYQRTGIASWYGRPFHGRKTASGARYNMYAMTAAHKSLPLSSYVRVTHLGNGRSVVVKINDRGPFKPGRIIDLSLSAAKRLGILKTGTARVRVVALGSGRGGRMAATDTESEMGNREAVAESRTLALETGIPRYPVLDLPLLP